MHRDACVEHHFNEWANDSLQRGERGLLEGVIGMKVVRYRSAHLYGNDSIYVKNGTNELLSRWMLQAYDCCGWREKRIAATRARTALIGKVRKYFLRIWKGGAVKATVRAKVITILGAVMLTG